ncbi:unnamed protein product [Cylindrotheca closterium]|uniref:Histidine kinase domain-containing protein n=1 Tax=Cylindrotheca closterium TaxID=2856 RepID=A0AAD2JMF0_9STRA|nr:unnamed protein product [Cylindrotheca closterium]
MHQMQEEHGESPSLASLTSLSQLSHEDYLDEVKLVDHHFRLNAYFVTAAWLLLILWSYWITPPEQLETLDGPEFYSALFATLFMFLSMMGRFSALFWLEARGDTRNFSGVLVASLMTQIIAFLNNALMCCGIPVPVHIDPVFGTRIFLLRWCAWAPLGYYMTFLVAGIDPGAKLKNAYLLGLTQGLSTLTGFVFPMCKHTWQWIMVMIFAVVLFGCMFPALYVQKSRFARMRKGSSAHSVELFDRSRLAYQLMLTCTVAWSSLVWMYFVAGASMFLTPKDASIADLWVNQRPYFPMIWECSMDVILKNLYLNIIVQVHKVAFDDGERADRRLIELRRLMSAVWERSSDVICVSVQGIGGTITTMVSPVYLELYHGRTESNAILFEIGKEDVESRSYSNIQPRSVREIDFHSLPAPGSHVFTDFGQDMDIGTLNSTLDDSLLTSLAGMIARGWSLIGDQKSLTHRLLKVRDGAKKFTSCEANICRLENNAMLMVIRDISERAKRFEAEKKMILEATARKKDAEANRFTRHEVKNGLLAAIHLCDSLKDTSFNGDDESSKDSSTASDSGQSGVARAPARKKTIAEPKAEVSVYTRELDKTLRTILDTILSEAMARDVIHGNYEPKMERVELKRLLNAGEMRSDRFKLNTTPSPLPSLYIDPQLLLYIHRNAVSNACKYGQTGGDVTTEIVYDESSEVLRIEVVNLPGPEHERLLRLGDQAATLVFEPGRRLHSEHDGGSQVRRGTHSAGDGAWIIWKCAETLRGKANIRFEQERTVFSLICPAKRFGQRAIQSEIFQIPSNAWGIAIDDSKIQRRLLSKFLSHAGVPESRQIIQGSTAEEIRAFDSFLVDLVEKNSEDYFLVIVDENLDITENGTLRSTVSGSECIQRVRQRLAPEHERRILGLVRSANDSSQDIASYLSRAHGFVSKAPVRSSSVAETIAPLWKKRFNYLPIAVEATGTAGAMPIQNLDNEGMTDFVILVVKELRSNLDAVDELSSEDSNASLVQNWPLIWEKLHCLKGDLSSLFNTRSIMKAVGDINAMRGPDLPERFVARWITLRSEITDIASTIGSNFSDGERKRSRKRPNTKPESSGMQHRRKKRS